ncbi:uncharacterized protein [Vicugna pacos]|uniref:Uncharacterized protein n=1 Tax=Vicugna pacos TaxID=30538 RepID=A0ABM5CNX8_VICPA
MLRRRSPSASGRPRRPLQRAAAAEAERGARLQLPDRLRRRRRRRRARRSSGRPATCAAQTLREPQLPPPRQVSCSFQKFSLQHLCSSSSLLRSPFRVPSPLRAPLRSSPPPGPSGRSHSPSVPSGEFLDQVVVPIGRRGGREPGTTGRRPIRRRRPGAEPGRAEATLRETLPPGKLRRARSERREALEGPREPRAGKRARQGRPGEAGIGKTFSHLCGRPGEGKLIKVRPRCRLSLDNILQNNCSYCRCILASKTGIWKERRGLILCDPTTASTRPTNPSVTLHQAPFTFTSDTAFVLSQEPC